MTLEEATTKVQKLTEYNAGKFGDKVNFQFDEGIIHLDDSISPALIINEQKEAPCTLKMSIENFGKMMEGDLNPMMAFMGGKMKIDGDKGVAMKLASLF
ncbi:MAG: SCP2 sterol-binding domain-containing protein [Cytophagales bacterium]|nr:SCP2 sterol-binding domain-containing protein [Cytophagales bacterium]